MKLLTITRNRLLTWERTRNGVAIEYGEGTDDVIKTAGKLLFSNMADRIKNKDVVSPCKEFNKECEIQSRKIAEFYKSRGCDEIAATRIKNKFKGNVGEIMTEAYFNYGYGTRFINKDTYLPIDDPDNEDHTDGSAIGHDNFPIIIQIKNYIREYTDWATLELLAGHARKIWMDVAKKEQRFDINEKRGLLVSFSDVDRYKTHYDDDNKINEVISIMEPKEIDNELNNRKESNYQFFQEIVQSI